MGQTMCRMRLGGWDLRMRGAPATAAALLLVLVPAAQAAPAPTQLTIAGPDKAVSAGGKAKLTATLTSAGKPVAGKTILFASGATEVGKAATDSKGHASKRVKLTAPASFVATYTP